jgi:hypothetical protein
MARSERNGLRGFKSLHEKGRHDAIIHRFDASGSPGCCVALLPARIIGKPTVIMKLLISL